MPSEWPTFRIRYTDRRGTYTVIERFGDAEPIIHDGFSTETAALKYIDVTQAAYRELPPREGL